MSDPLTDFDPAPDPADGGAPDYLDAFVPAPTRARTAGWTPERQRAFLLALRECGLISVAAKSVGKTHQSAYRLRNRPGAEGFAAAWDRALSDARCLAFEVAYKRSMDGYQTPRFYRGKFVRMEHRYDLKMMIAAIRASHARQPAKRDK
jgi:hypothetical protein